MSIDYEDHSKVLIALKEVQDSEQDMRDAAKEAKVFLYAKDGQWDEYARAKMSNRYRGTFDLCWPIVDGINGEIAEADFTITISPSGGGATDKDAKIYNGLIRHIKDISGADDVFNSASASNVIGGFDCVEVKQKYIDADSFDQDLFISRVPNAIDSVWFDPSSIESDRSDAGWAIKSVALPTETYKERFPEGKGVSVGSSCDTNAFDNKLDTVTVGQLFYKKPETTTLILMSDGSVYKDDESYGKVKDELAATGVIEENRRERRGWKVCSRLFDGSGWLKDSQETVFGYIPLIPIYGNFEIIENKPVYMGKIEKLYDHQRALNYSLSRGIEDEALSPAEFFWMTDEMAMGNEAQYKDMNTDGKRVRTFNPDPEMPGFFPQKTLPSQAGGALQTNTSNLMQLINASSNTFQAQQGNANAMQSGIAGQQQIEQGNIGSVKWFKAMQVMQRQVARVIVNAIPKVYDGKRQQRILAEDGTATFITLNDVIFDQQTKQNITVNNLAKGQYGITCDFGPAFNSQQKETAQRFIDMASINPAAVEMGMDIWLKNESSPGMDQLAERFRKTMIANGLIPEDQMTDDEKQLLQQQQQEAANQPPQEDPMMVAARAEEGKAQAALMDAQNKQMQVQGEQQIKMAEIKLAEQQLMLEVQKFQRAQDDKYNVDAAKIDQGQQKIDLDTKKMMNDFMLKLAELESKVSDKEEERLREAALKPISNAENVKDS